MQIAQHLILAESHDFRDATTNCENNMGQSYGPLAERISIKQILAAPLRLLLAHAVLPLSLYW